MPHPQALDSTQLRRICDPNQFQFQSTSEIEPLDKVIGQERAVRSVELGLNINQPDYNVFITGQEGSGKRTIVQDIVTLHAKQKATPEDWCMVNNFDDEFRPRSICLPPGRATKFAKSMTRLIRALQIELGKAFETDSFKEKAVQVQSPFRKKEEAIARELEQLAKKYNIQITKSDEGVRAVPTIEGKPMTQEQFQDLSEKEKETVNIAIQKISEEMEQRFREIAEIKQALQKAATALVEDTARRIVTERIDVLREEYAGCDQVHTYLDTVLADIVDEARNFIQPDNIPEPGPEPPLGAASSVFDKYRVNVLVDRNNTPGAPVVFEPNPSFQNLFGHIDTKTFMGATTTDFTMVQAGSLLQANGGYLILEVETILMDGFTWEALKRALLNKQLYIQAPPRSSGMFTGNLRPEPIALDVKIILLGNYQTFEILQSRDTNFNKIFKVRADFDYETLYSGESAQLYAQFIARVCKENKLLPFTPEAVAAIVEYGQKTVSSQVKLSLRFGPIVGILQEADYWAQMAKTDMVTLPHVIKAMNEYRFRYNLYEEKIHENYADETVLIDVMGDVVGQVNALAVYQIGEISFGRPSRITAETYMGRQGIVNIEREAGMSGGTHDKGVMILSGYLGRTFAQKYPLSLSISITFEQNYAGIDGDSASSTELYAILSSLSGIPIHQGIAVTGSVNQKGQIQAIGGVNEKIEGFFEVCKTKGLTGHQGVMIPGANVNNLMLNREIIEAAEQGRFHIFGVTTIAEGIEILTGQSAGTADEEGEYPPETVFGKAQRKLAYYLRQALRLKGRGKDFPGP